MDSRSHNLFAKAGWNIDEDRRLQLTANRYELQGNNDYLTVNGNTATGHPGDLRRGSRKAKARATAPPR